jgi:hypothetical protein
VDTRRRENLTRLANLLTEPSPGSGAGEVLMALEMAGLRELGGRDASLLSKGNMLEAALSSPQGLL